MRIISNNFVRIEKIITFARIKYILNKRTMNTKLTLTIEKSVIEKAKKYAKEKEHSLSDLIENYLKAITKEKKTEIEIDTPIIQSLKGSFHMPSDFDYKKELTENLSKKYL
jgi:hypothetical protein